MPAIRTPLKVGCVASLDDIDPLEGLSGPKLHLASQVAKASKADHFENIVKLRKYLFILDVRVPWGLYCTMLRDAAPKSKIAVHLLSNSLALAGMT